MPKSAPKTFAEYASGFPAGTKKLLHQMREAIQKAAPQAEETIMYAMPAFRLDGMLVSFAAYGKFIGFYPGASGIAAFDKELAGYQRAKGSVRFPAGEPLPLALVSRIVRFRVKERLAAR